MKAVETDIPDFSLTEEFLPVDYTDTFKCTVQEGITFSPDDLQIAFWTEMPGWVNALMKLRNLLVKPFGLQVDGRSAAKVEASIRNSETYRFFSVAAKNKNETVVLLTDKHLNAWMSILIDGNNVYAITLVKYNNRLGRVYFFVIKPFHKIVVRSALVSTVRRLSQKREKTDAPTEHNLGR